MFKSSKTEKYISALWDNFFRCHTPISCMLLLPCTIHKKDREFMKKRKELHRKHDERIKNNE